MSVSIIGAKQTDVAIVESQKQLVLADIFKENTCALKRAGIRMKSENKNGNNKEEKKNNKN